jgi:hypothetical protein
MQHFTLPFVSATQTSIFTQAFSRRLSGAGTPSRLATAQKVQSVRSLCPSRSRRFVKREIGRRGTDGRPRRLSFIAVATASILDLGTLPSCRTPHRLKTAFFAGF